MTATQQPPIDAPPTSRRSVWIAVAAGVAVALLLLIGWVIWGGGNDDATAPDEPRAAASSEPTGTAPSASPTPIDSGDPTVAPSDSGAASPATTSGPDTNSVPSQPGVPISDVVAIDETAAFADGVTARITDLVAIEGVGQGAGEIGGPAVRVTIELENGTAEDAQLGDVVVLMYSGADDAPAVPLLGDPTSKPFSGTVKPAGKATGSYVFNIPPDRRDEVTVTVSYQAAAPIVVFEGSAPR